jgi:tRNA(Ile)-lysidine synthase TilS/MesJ
VDLTEKICTNCVLTASFPGIEFDQSGVCNFCSDYKGRDYQKNRRAEYSQRFDKMLAARKGRSAYDVLMCHSGGKDSTYTLAVLKEQYRLSILAISFDNGFLPAQTLNNIREVVDKLGVDHIYVKPHFNLLAKIFRQCAENDIYPTKFLERSSAICTSCMGIIKYYALRFALEMDIPFVAYGWSPGQAPITSSINVNNPTMVRQMQKTIYGPLFRIAGDAIRPYFLEDKHFGGQYHFPYNIHPLAFLEYDLDKIYQDISRFGWKKPEGVDANSTNCLLNSLGCDVHKKRLGFHPYAFELANLVREGNISRSTALERLQEPEDPKTLQMVIEKLAVKRE